MLESMVPKPPRFPRGGLRVLLPQALEDEAVYRGVVLEGVSLEGRALQAVSFEGCVFREVNLRGVVWERVRLADVRFEGCDLSGAQWPEGSLERAEVVKSRLLGFRAPGLRLRHVQFLGVQAALSSWVKVDAAHVRMQDCDFADADFLEAQLPGVVFRDCRLERAQFSRARLSGADLRGSNLRRAGFTVKELEDVLVEPQQLLDLAHLLGVKVQSLDEDNTSSRSS